MCISIFSDIWQIRHTSVSQIIQPKVDPWTERVDRLTQYKVFNPRGKS